VLAIDAKAENERRYLVGGLHSRRPPSDGDRRRQVGRRCRKTRRGRNSAPRAWTATGTQAGYDIELTRAIADSVRIPVIASGGAGTLEHIYEALTAGGADAALIASIVHYQIYTIQTDQRLPRRARGYRQEYLELSLYDLLVFNEQGHIPAVIQDDTTGQVLTLCYMTKEALDKTLETG